MLTKMAGLMALLVAFAAVAAPAACSAAFLEMKDGAKIYYEDRGRGEPIVLVHGWTCSTAFWRSNAPELAKDFRVVTIDLRGHGNSSKILTGHTVDQYARDVREVIERLGLRDATLVGWSLGGPVVLSYWQQFAGDSRLKGIGLVDSGIAPFSPAAWNRHGLRNYNYTALHGTLRAYQDDPLRFMTAFTANMFKDGKATGNDLAWIPAELTKTPPWIGAAIYSDFAASDYSGVLPTLTVPAIVFAADSNVFREGIEMGRGIAALMPRATFVPFADAGHLLFYEQPARFNKALADFVKGIR